MNNGDNFLFCKQYQIANKKYNELLKEHPKNTEVIHRQSEFALMLGSFQEGWKNYEYRWKVFPMNKVTKRRHSVEGSARNPASKIKKAGQSNQTNQTQPELLGVPGEKLPKVSHYYNDPHYYATQKTIVVGASNSAVDAALEIYRKGGDVTMIVRKPEIGERVKYWVRPDILNRIEEGSIKAYFNASLKEIKETETALRKNLAQLRMARYTLIAMGAFTFAMFFVDVERVKALADISNLFYLSGAGIVGAYMGTTAWMNKK